MATRRILGVIAALLLTVLLWYLFLKKNSIPSDVMAELEAANSFEIASSIS